MRGPIITMMMRLDSSASVYQGLASILGGSHATIQQPQRSTATEKRGAKGHYHLQTVTATRNPVNNKYSTNTNGQLRLCYPQTQMDTIRDNINKIIKGHLTSSLAAELFTLIELFVLQRRNNNNHILNTSEEEGEQERVERNFLQSEDDGQREYEGGKGHKEDGRRGSINSIEQIPSTALSPFTATATPTTVREKKKRGGDNDLPERNRLADKTSGEDKLKLTVTFGKALARDVRSKSTLTDASQITAMVTVHYVFKSGETVGPPASESFAVMARKLTSG
ncbi:hypothetical protein BC829DRAFT_441730 [Chytridium lagenaria]|nr:hypothetical protein BC829DRAFT_441730 [Chytridium lagenaria]